MKVRLILRDGRIVGEFHLKEDTKISQLPNAFSRGGTNFFSGSGIQWDAKGNPTLIYQEGTIWEATATLQLASSG